MFSRRLLSMCLLALGLLTWAGCAPAEEPVVEEAAPEPAPPPPPTVYDLGEVDIVEAEPGFSSRNIRFGGIQIGDVANDVLDVLGDQTGTTGNSVDNAYYVSAYRDGGLVIYTFKINGEIRQIEIFTRLADEIASPAIRAWLEDGDMDAVREWMGQERAVDEVVETGGTEYAYDPRGIRFITYGEQQHSIRFSYLP